MISENNAEDSGKMMVWEAPEICLSSHLDNSCTSGICLVLLFCNSSINEKCQIFYLTQLMTNSKILQLVQIQQGNILRIDKWMQTGKIDQYL